MWKISTFLKPECRWGSTSITFSTASRTTLSVSLLWSAFILSLKSLKILVYLSWHMFWHTPSLLVWVLRCSIFGEEALNFLVWVETETFSMGWGIVGISWLELTASVSGSGSYRERKNLWIQILKQNKLTSSFPWGKKCYMTNASTINVNSVWWWLSAQMGHGIPEENQHDSRRLFGRALLTSGALQTEAHISTPHSPASLPKKNHQHQRLCWITADPLGLLKGCYICFSLLFCLKGL